jgi:1-phosphofructokinase family hexose kinase
MFVTLTLNPAIDQTLSISGELALNHIFNISAETSTPGGKGVNVAKILAANGQTVTAAGLLGEDRLAFFSDALLPAGIACRFLPLPHPTRLNLMISDGQGRELKLNRPGFPALPYDESAIKAYARTLAAPDSIIILSGSLPVQFPPHIYATLIRLFHAAGCPTVIDVAGPALTAALPEKPDVIKPNRHELEAVLGTSLTSQEAMLSALHGLMPNHQAIIVSDGDKGAWFAGNGQIWFAAAPPITCVDTTGAGDSLLGQFCADYFPNRTLTPELIARAVAAGSAAVERHGTPLIARERIEELARQVHPELRH